MKKSLSRWLTLAARYVEKPKALRVKMRGGIPGTFWKLDQPWFHQLGIRTVIDVGANMGQFSLTARTLLPRAMIYAFEPIPSCFRVTEDFFRNDPRYQIFQLALSDTHGTSEFTVASGDTGASSLLTASDAQQKYFPATLNGTRITVPLETLDRVAFGLKIDSPVALQIDVQGYEYQVLAGASQTLENVQLVILEASFVQFYQDQALFDEVYALLRSLGFRLLDVFNMVHAPDSSRALQGDFLFIKDSSAASVRRERL